MKNPKRLKQKFKLFLRKIGMLCKKYTKTTNRIRISKTIFPNGEEIIHPSYLTKTPENPHSFESELHVYHELRKSILKKSK
jgi:hypothetical protein